MDCAIDFFNRSVRLESMQNTMQNTKIRWMTKEDLESVAEVSKSCGLPLELVLDFSTKKSSICKVFEQDGNVIGFALYKTGKKSIKISYIAIDREFRRKSIGSMFINSIRNKDKKKYVETLVSDDNLEAHLFLKKNGFVAKDIVPSSDGNSNYKFVLGEDL